MCGLATLLSIVRQSESRLGAEVDASGGVLAGFGGAPEPRAQVSEAWRAHPNMAPFLHGLGKASTSVLCPSYTCSTLGSGRAACALTENLIYCLNDASKYRPMTVFSWIVLACG